MPLFRRKRAGDDPDDAGSGGAGGSGSPAEGDVFELASHLSFANEKLRVEPRDDQTVAVAVEEREESAAVEVFAPDLRRAVFAASLPTVSSNATIRGVGGTVEVSGLASSCQFRVREYDRDVDVTASVPVEPLAGLVSFLDENGGLAVAVAAAGGPVGAEYEAECANWRPQRLSVRAEGDQAVVKATEVVSEEWEQIETVRVPLDAFAAAVRLAGGDLPGRCHFSVRRGRLSASFDRKTALSMQVTTDEVDGDTIIPELNGEQLQDLRRHLESWLQPPTDPPATPPTD